MSKILTKILLEFQPLTLDTWADFENLFGDKGACGGCWCMWWRLNQKKFNSQKGEKNKKEMYDIVASKHQPGILAYHNNTAIGWCSVAPRKEFIRLSRSKILKPVDDQNVWSIVCLFVTKEFRQRGISVQLLKETINFVKKRGGNIIEGYAVEPKKDKMPDVFAFHGLYSAYLSAGFEEVARRSETRPIMRYCLQAGNEIEPDS